MKTVLPTFLVVILLGILAYARWIEPQWIEVSRYSVNASVSRKTRIAHISDLHLREMGKRESKIWALVRAAAPDAILITGDSIAENANYEAIKIFFQEIKAPLGVWSVKGNWEHWRPSENEEETYNAAGIKILNNESVQLTQNIWIVGVDDESGVPNLERALESVPENAFKIGLFHSPHFFDSSKNRFNLVLSGHTHGGQVRIPFFPPFWLPPGSGRFVAGWYQNEDSRMYVSRGLGNSILDIRFACRPELPILDLIP